MYKKKMAAGICTGSTAAKGRMVAHTYSTWPANTNFRRRNACMSNEKFLRDQAVAENGSLWLRTDFRKKEK